MVSVTVHQCECCQAAECDDAGELREHNRLLGLGLAELAKALGAMRRENARLEAAKRQLTEELKTAYRRYDGPPVELWADSVRKDLAARRAESTNPYQAIEDAAAAEIAAGPNGAKYEAG